MAESPSRLRPRTVDRDFVWDVAAKDWTKSEYIPKSNTNTNLPRDGIGVPKTTRNALGLRDSRSAWVSSSLPSALSDSEALSVSGASTDEVVSLFLFFFFFFNLPMWIRILDQRQPTFEKPFGFALTPLLQECLYLSRKLSGSSSSSVSLSQTLTRGVGVSGIASIGGGARYESPSGNSDEEEGKVGECGAEFFSNGLLLGKSESLMKRALKAFAPMLLLGSVDEALGLDTVL